MNFRKMTAAIAAAAVLAVAAPMTGVLPNPLGITASAAEYKVGDVFYVGFDSSGSVKGEPASDVTEDMVLNSAGQYVCTVLSDNTLSVHFISVVAHYNAPLTIPSQICGYTVTKIEAGNRKVDSITILDTVTTIGEGAFADDFLLKEVKFGANSQLAD